MYLVISSAIIPHISENEVLCSRAYLLQRGSLGGSGGDDDGVLHGVILLESFDKLGDSGSLLANSNVDDVELLRLVGAVVPPALVEHGVQGDGGLAGLTIADDKLTLATSDRYHGVDGLKTGLHGLVDGAARQDTGSLHLSTALLGGLDWALAIDGVSESIDDTSKQSLADWNVDLRNILDAARFGLA